MPDALPPLPPHLDRALTRAIARWVPPLTGIDAADLRQEALLAWWQVTQRYDPTRGVPLAGYAWPRVLGRVQELRRAATTTRRSHARYWYVPLERLPLDGAPGRARRRIREWPHARPPPCREVWLWRRVNRLPRQQRYVIIRLYWSGWTQEQIARHLQRHPSRVFALHRTALRALRLMCVLDLLEGL